MGPREHPQPDSIKDAIKLYGCGFAMGTADLVPGISGGTLAFLTGIYSDLVHSVSSIHLGPLLKLQFRQFIRETAWLYLLIVLTGMATAIVSLAKVVHLLMDDPVSRSYMYSGFLGFITASAIICLRRMGGTSKATILPLILGAFVAFLGTWNIQERGALDLATLGIFQPHTIASGALAICAMMLPGVSGSYVLHMLGMYQTTIAALASLESTSSILFLVNLGSGIFFGALLFSKVVAWLLDHYRTLTFAALTGLMIGALPTLWPQAAFSWPLLLTGVGSFLLVMAVEHYALHLQRLERSV